MGSAERFGVLPATVGVDRTTEKSSLRGSGCVVATPFRIARSFRGFNPDCDSFAMSLMKILQRLDAVFHIYEIEGVIVCQPTMLENLHDVFALRASAQCFGFVFDVFLSDGSEPSNNLPCENLIVT